MAAGIRINLLNGEQVLADNTSNEWVIDLWDDPLWDMLALIEPDVTTGNVHRLLMMGVGT